MIKSKKQMYIVVGAFALVLMLFTTTYAFFNYTRTGTANIIRTGRINFNSEQGTAINLTNLFPIDVSEEIPNDNTKVGTVTINITGDTTYSEGIEYLVSAVNVQNTVGSGQNAKTLPISIDVAIANNTENTPSTTLGTNSDSYFTDRGSTTSYYSVLSDDVIENNEKLVVGYIAAGQTGVDGNIVIRAYLDASKIAITDTYPSGTVRTVKTTGYSSNDCETVLDGVTNASTYCASAADLQGAVDGENLTSAQIALLVSAGIVEEYTDGTTSQWVGDRVVFTTAEWNSLQTNGVSFQIKVEANEGTWVKNPIVCTRVTNVNQLHTEICSQTNNYCAGDGYTGSNTSIIYGNAKALNTNTLTTGDAFDCDVNGNGIVDVDTNNNSTERFYYVSPYLDTATTYSTGVTTFDNTYATLIYYKNFVNGVPSDGHTVYYSVSQNYNGPGAAVTHLPSTSTWSNVSLRTSTRAILAENRSTHNSTSTSGGTLPEQFSYSGYAARLLTAQELMEGCGLSQVGNETIGELSNCNFLFEETKYADNNKATFGPWLETPQASDYSNVWYANVVIRIVGHNNANASDYNGGIGVRPVIDVPISQIAK